MSTVKTNTLTGTTTAGSISVTGEGNSTTTNLQQGLCKAYATHTAAVSVLDSFNESSVSDTGTGHFGLNFTSNMANANYVGTGSNIGSDDSFATGFISDGAVPLSSRMDYQFRNYDTVVATDQDFQRVMTHGDLA